MKHHPYYWDDNSNTPKKKLTYKSKPDGDLSNQELP
jgi:hypothetical protein